MMGPSAPRSFPSCERPRAPPWPRRSPAPALNIGRSCGAALARPCSAPAGWALLAAWTVWGSPLGLGGSLRRSWCIAASRPHGVAAESGEEVPAAC